MNQYLDLFYNTLPPVSLTAYKKFLASFSYDLPEDYAKFLNLIGSGNFRSNKITINVPDASAREDGNKDTDRKIEVLWIYGLADGDVPNETISMREWNKIPPNSIAIAADGGGNRFLMSLAENTFGHVYFWDHERIDTETAQVEIHDFKNMYFIASSFEEFLILIKKNLD